MHSSSSFPMVRSFVIVLGIMLISCGEDEITPINHDGETSSDAISDENGRRKLKELLSSFWYNDRIYDFSYDEAGRIENITATENGTILYTYVPHYNGDQLISSDLVEGGMVMSSNTHFLFDKKGNIISYDYLSYFFPEYPDGIAFPYSLAYDKKGNISRMTDNSILLYDNKRNAIQWGDRQFTFDTKKLNPFYVYDNLWLVFVEEPFYAELMLNPNIMTSQTFPNGVITIYENVYDNDGRLITRISKVNGSVIETMQFTYK
ncbi:MAG TPA: hypothetical protein VD927_03300 [Chryseosolibacter sp.]|nr:hypothetical protein [Chryseosolibacter sp.]